MQTPYKFQNLLTALRDAAEILEQSPDFNTPQRDHPRNVIQEEADAISVLLKNICRAAGVTVVASFAAENFHFGITSIPKLDDPDFDVIVPSSVTVLSVFKKVEDNRRAMMLVSSPFAMDLAKTDSHYAKMAREQGADFSKWPESTVKYYERLQRR